MAAIWTKVCNQHVHSVHAVPGAKQSCSNMAYLLPLAAAVGKHLAAAVSRSLGLAANV
jgi:hypothetical protein